MKFGAYSASFSWMREPEETKFALCEELGIGLVAWGPLGQGFLTGAITRDMKFDDPDDLRKDFPRFTPEALEANFRIVDFLMELAAQKGITPGSDRAGVAAGPEAGCRDRPLTGGAPARLTDRSLEHENA
jgi:aryl-alcohol dehydrogenase-like predicted oxidoreductase